MAGTRRYSKQASLEAIVRYNPELSALKELLRVAYENRSTAVKQARGAAQGTTSAIDRVRPQVAAIYNAAGLEQARAGDTLIGKDLAGLGPVADSIKAGAALEQATGLRHLQEGQTAALTDLGSRRVAAQEGAQFAQQAAQREFVSSVAKVLSRRQDLAREQGAFEASTMGKLAEDQAARDATSANNLADNTQSERNSLRSAGIDPDTGKPIKGGPLDPKPKPGKDQWAPQAAHRDFIKEYQSALTLLGSEIDPGKRHGRGEAQRSLIKGEPEVKGKDKNLVLQTVVPEIKPHDPLAVRVAADMFYDQHLSPETVRLLHENKYRVKALPGVATWDEKRRARQRAQRNPPNTGNWLRDAIMHLQGG